MPPDLTSRRSFLGLAGAAGASVLAGVAAGRAAAALSPDVATEADAKVVEPQGAADHTIHIGDGLVEAGPQRILSVVTYNGGFPGPLLRLKEGRRVVVDIHNDTDIPEQLHWHGQSLPASVDGAGEEGTPFISARGMRRIAFTPGPPGLRCYHTHLAAGANLRVGQYTGQFGPVYIEPKREPGAYDREVFLSLKEFEPYFMHGADSDPYISDPTAALPELKAEAGRSAQAVGTQQPGFAVGYSTFTINGRMLGHGEPIRVKQGERVLFHVLNGSATEIRSLALPGHSFKVVALDGNPVPAPAEVPVLWIGTAERVSAIVEMNRPGAWVLGDVSDEARNRGMGIVVEYAGRTGKAQWVAPAASRWDYTRFGRRNSGTAVPEETVDLTFAKRPGAADGFDQWTVNGEPFDWDKMEPLIPLRLGGRYRLRMRNASDRIHPLHLHRHSFELIRIAGKITSGVMKDVVMLGPYQEMEVDFTADQPGLTLFHCQTQTRMDYGFMALLHCA